MTILKLIAFIKTWMYCGADRLFYTSHASIIHRYNRRNLRLLYPVSVICCALYSLAGLIFLPFRRNAPLYTVYFFAFVVYGLLVKRLYSYHPAFAFRLFSFLCLSFSILLGTVRSPHTPAVLFFILSVTLTAAFCAPLIDTMCFHLLMALLFLGASFYCKPLPLALWDLSNCLFSFVASCIIAYFLGVALVRLLKAGDALHIASNTDELTGLRNRRDLNSYLAQTYAQQPHLQIALLDVDDFKLYNDTYGHLEGDHCLQRVADVLRTASLQYHFYVARYGGEEFCIIDAEKSTEQMVRILRNVLDRISALDMKNQKSSKHYVSLSAGLASGALHTTQTDAELLNLADEALYLAKSSGKNALSTPDGRILA